MITSPSSPASLWRSSLSFSLNSTSSSSDNSCNSSNVQNKKEYFRYFQKQNGKIHATTEGWIRELGEAEGRKPKSFGMTIMKGRTRTEGGREGARDACIRRRCRRRRTVVSHPAAAAAAFAAEAKHKIDSAPSFFSWMRTEEGLEDQISDVMTL